MMVTSVFLGVYNGQIGHLAKLKAFADNKINATQKLEFDLGRVENIVGKGENASYQPLPIMFSKAFFLGTL